MSPGVKNWLFAGEGAFFFLLLCSEGLMNRGSVASWLPHEAFPGCVGSAACSSRLLNLQLYLLEREESPCEVCVAMELRKWTLSLPVECCQHGSAAPFAAQVGN